MAISRYKNDGILNLNKQIASPKHLGNIRSAINSGRISILNTIILNEDQRLDILAGQFYGDGRYWWILAIASGIGYGLQVPPGTIISVPDLADVLANL